MVLEEACNTTDTFSSSPSPSDTPAWSAETDAADDNSPSFSQPGNWLKVVQQTDTGSNVPVYINLSSLPSAWRYGPNTAKASQIMTNGLRSQIQFVGQTLQRPVRQDEADALAFHFAKSLRLASYGSPIGGAAAAVFAYRGRNEYRFPFWTPFKEGSRFSKDAFGPLRGFQARVLWQSLRLSAYGIAGVILGQMFFGSYALTVSLTGRARDPRLKDFTEAILAKQRSGLGRDAKGKRVEDESPGARGMETYDMARQRRGLQEMGGRNRDDQTSDDASPTGSAFSEDYMRGAEQQQGFMSEEDVRRQADERMSSSQDRSSPWQSGNTSENAPSQESRASREAQSKPTGSAWDRLRQEAISSSAGKTSTRGNAPSESAGSRASAQSSGNTTVGDAFSFSSSDADRDLPKGEARQDFDKRSAREREGKDFEDRSGSRRW